MRAVFIVVAMAACGSPHPADTHNPRTDRRARDTSADTPYRRASVGTLGYTDDQLANGDIIIRAIVNAATPDGTAERYVWRRAREICPNGFIRVNVPDRSDPQDFAAEIACPSPIVTGPAVDAGIDQVPDMVAETISKEKGPSVRETLGSEVVVTTETEATKSSDTSDNVDYENGVAVISFDKPTWCVTSGKLNGFCFETARDCGKVSKSCASRRAWACFRYRIRTSGQHVTACTETYGRCSTMHLVATHDAEMTDVDDCVIFRTKTKK